jgi:putative phosphoesterase
MKHAIRVAAIYDIHGNLPALEAVLREIDRISVELILVGGDVASGPMPRETIERLMGLGDQAVLIRGNADRELVAHYDRSLPPAPDEEDIWFLRDQWAARQITKEQRDYLASLSETTDLEIEGLGSVLFCHGSPRSDEEIITEQTSEQRLRDALTGVDQRLIVCGHTHMQFDRSLDDVRIVNAGSVGMPYEGRPGAYWALLGPGVSLRRTDYDFREAAELISASSFPDVDDAVEGMFSKPPSRIEATQTFERLAEERSRDV